MGYQIFTVRSLSHISMNPTQDDYIVIVRAGIPQASLEMWFKVMVSKSTPVLRHHAMKTYAYIEVTPALHRWSSKVTGEQLASGCDRLTCAIYAVVYTWQKSGSASRSGLDAMVAQWQERNHDHLTSCSHNWAALAHQICIPWQV
jgi:hypothetical protein